VLQVGNDRRTDDDAWLLLINGADIQDAPVGRVFDSATGKRSYAMAVPLFDAAGLELPPRHPARHPAAILGMRRDASYIEAEVVASGRRIFPLFLVMVLGVAVGVRFAVSQIVLRPLRRLLEGIDAVGKGDLSRVLLAERDDEIGELAGRFNAMTGSLREAREEMQRAATARLGLEARLRQSEKLATIGQMAAEIAHEVGTPLNVIGGRARALGKNRTGKSSAFDHETHLGIEMNRARVQIEGADEDQSAIDRERFGMETGGRAPALVGLFLVRRVSILPRIVRLELVDSRAAAQQSLAALGVPGMHRTDVGGRQ